jgi:hypothetical protein
MQRRNEANLLKFCHRLTGDALSWVELLQFINRPKVVQDANRDWQLAGASIGAVDGGSGDRTMPKPTLMA